MKKGRKKRKREGKRKEKKEGKKGNRGKEREKRGKGKKKGRKIARFRSYLLPGALERFYALVAVLVVDVGRQAVGGGAVRVRYSGASILRARKVLQ